MSCITTVPRMYDVVSLNTKFSQRDRRHTSCLESPHSPVLPGNGTRSTVSTSTLVPRVRNERTTVFPLPLFREFTGHETPGPRRCREGPSLESLSDLNGNILSETSSSLVVRPRTTVREVSRVRWRRANSTIPTFSSETR